MELQIYDSSIIITQPIGRFYRTKRRLEVERRTNGLRSKGPGTDGRENRITDGRLDKGRKDLWKIDSGQKDERTERGISDPDPHVHIGSGSGSACLYWIRIRILGLEKYPDL